MLRLNQSQSDSRRTLLRAKIIFNDKSSIFDCTVTRMSADTAELKLSNANFAPGTFKLVIKPHDDTYICDVIGRTPSSLTVSLIKHQPTIAFPKKKPPTLGW